MKELIDKSAILTEIDEIVKGLQKNCNPNPMGNIQECLAAAQIEALNLIKDFLDTLETKTVDLNQEIKNGINNLSNLYCYMEDLFNGNEEEGVYPIPEKVKNELFEFAKHFFELGLKARKGE